MQAPNSRHLAAMAVKRPATASAAPPAKRPHVGGVAAESVAKMMGIGATPSSTISFGRAGFAAFMDKVGLQDVAQDLLQAAQQRPQKHVAASSAAPTLAGTERQQHEALNGVDAKPQNAAGGAPAAPFSQRTAAGLQASSSPQPPALGSSSGAASVGAYAARERAVVDCFATIVQQAAASCTPSHSQQPQQTQLPGPSHQRRAPATSALDATTETAAAPSPKQTWAAVAHAPAAGAAADSGECEGMKKAIAASANQAT